jgi:hypothetical protein
MEAHKELPARADATAVSVPISPARLFAASPGPAHSKTTSGRQRGKKHRERKAEPSRTRCDFENTTWLVACTCHGLYTPRRSRVHREHLINRRSTTMPQETSAPHQDRRCPFRPGLIHAELLIPIPRSPHQGGALSSQQTTRRFPSCLGSVEVLRAFVFQLTRGYGPRSS